MHMRTTLNIDEKPLEEAARCTGIKEKTAIVRAGLDSLIAREAARRLDAMGGTDRGATASTRRKRSN